MRKAALLFGALIAVHCGGSEFTGGSSGSSAAGSTATGGAAGAAGATSAAGGAPGSGGAAGAGLSAGGSAGVAGSTGSAGAGGTAGSGGKAGAGGATGTGGVAGSGGSAGTAGVAGAAGSAGKGGAAGASGAGGSVDAGRDGGDCSPACGVGRQCCDGRCAFVGNDVLNCGKCGNACKANAYCAGGTCTPIPCNGVACLTGTCCGSVCCSDAQLCCESTGPTSGGAVCATPVNGTCPFAACAPLCVCASPNTAIATPSGNRAIASLDIGDLVYSIDRGRLATVPIVRINRSAVSNHVVRRVALATGGVLEISGGHPTADGRLFEGLRAGDALDGVAIESISTVPYEHPYTYDILPASDTGSYFAAGVLIGSTLANGARQVGEPTEPISR